MRRLLALACLLVLAAACGGEDSAGPTTTVADPGPPAQTTTEQDDETTAPTTKESDDDGPVVRIETEGGEEVVVAVEIAETAEERQVGLMNRESLPEDAGMIFLFEDDTDVGFWMKNTLIPLSIAFADDDGEIVAILDMEPCESEPCEIYDPGVPYRSALEVNQGAFESWGVAEGDRLRLDR